MTQHNKWQGRFLFYPESESQWSWLWTVARHFGICDTGFLLPAAVCTLSDSSTISPKLIYNENADWRKHHLFKYQPPNKPAFWVLKETQSTNMVFSFSFAGPALRGVRRSLGTQLAADAAKRQRSSMTWLTSCLYPTASALTWTRPPSWGWPSASCAHASCSPLVWKHTHT